VDQSGEKKIRQFDQQPEVRGLRDDRFKGLGGLGAGLGFQVFQQLQLLGLLFGLGGGAFLAREVLSQPVEGFALGFGSSAGVGQGAMHEQIGITTDRGGEMGVVGLGEAVVAEAFRRVDGTFQRTQQRDLQGIPIGPAWKKSEDFLNLPALGEIAGLDPVGDEELAVLLQP